MSCIYGTHQFGSNPAVMILGENTTAESAQQFMDQWRQENADRVLPFYTMVAFGTRHSRDAGATFLILALVFPPGTDAQAAAEAVGARLRDYVSLRYQKTLEDRWTFDRRSAPKWTPAAVALVVMRAADPPPTPEEEPLARAGIVLLDRPDSSARCRPRAGAVRGSIGRDRLASARTAAILQ
jgi:hypothetical protein